MKLKDRTAKNVHTAFVEEAKAHQMHACKQLETEQSKRQLTELRMEELHACMQPQGAC
jgi:hypothetical protein